jgi:hypothetical protein
MLRPFRQVQCSAGWLALDVEPVLRLPQGPHADARLRLGFAGRLRDLRFARFVPWNSIGRVGTSDPFGFRRVDGVRHMLTRAF